MLSSHFLILDKWQQIINPIFDKQFLISKQNQHLITLRDYLLPLLMNGQVSVNYHGSISFCVGNRK
jgi:type I restriction enzyme S subunit